VETERETVERERAEWVRERRWREAEKVGERESGVG
jgi:hypothetical protein